MKFLKLFFSAFLALMIATIAIWTGIFLVITSILAAPISAWWMKRKTTKTEDSSLQEANNTETSYKIIEVDYEIIENPKSQKKDR